MTTGSEGSGRPRTAPLALLAIAIVAVGIAAFVLGRRPAPPSPPEAGPAASPAGDAGGSSAAGATVAAAVPFHLTPEASIVAERYRCVCGCADPLNVCTCDMTPGSNEMKRTLQRLVDRKMTPEEIDRSMVETYGPVVLLSNPAPPAVPHPSPAPRRR